LRNNYTPDNWYFTEKADQKIDYEIAHISHTRLQLDAERDHMKEWLSDYTSEAATQRLEAFAGEWSLQEGQSVIGPYTEGRVNYFRLKDDGELEARGLLDSPDTRKQLRINSSGTWQHHEPYLTLFALETHHVRGVYDAIQGLDLPRSANETRWKVLNVTSERLRLRRTESGQVHVFESIE
jgi:hypothetical protein